MGRGEEEGGFFDCYQSRSSLSRHIHPQQKGKKKRTQHKRYLQFFCYLLTFSLVFVSTFVLLFSHLYSASLYLCIFLHLCSLVFL